MSSFSERSGWEDVIPVPQNDGPNAVAAIAYNPIFRELMDLFRAVLQTGELSERVLDLTEDILDENAANYTVWQYRRQCLRYLGSDLVEELSFMDTFAEENPKNYQIWYHRRAIVEEHGDAAGELEFCAKVFATDAKNYHAWAHRQWVLKTFNLWDGELEYTEELISSDIRNNSAWNQRWFIVHSGPEPVTPSILVREMEYTFNSILKVAKNESSWNYLRGLSRMHPETVDRIIEKCSEFEMKNIPTSSWNPLAISLLADLREAIGTEESLTHAERLYTCLCECDTIRIKYWTRRAEATRLRIEHIHVEVDE